MPSNFFSRLKDDYHKKRIHMFTYTPVGYEQLEIIANTSFSQRNQSFEKIFFNNATFRRFAIAVNKKHAFIISLIEILFWHQQVNLWQTRILKGSHPVLNFVATDIVADMSQQRKQRTFKIGFSEIELITSNTTMYYSLV